MPRHSAESLLTASVHGVTVRSSCSPSACSCVTIEAGHAAAIGDAMMSLDGQQNLAGRWGKLVSDWALPEPGKRGQSERSQNHTTLQHSPPCGPGDLGRPRSNARVVRQTMRQRQCSHAREPVGATRLPCSLLSVNKLADPCRRSRSHPDHVPAKALRQLAIADYRRRRPIGDRSVLARAITLIESARAEHQAQAQALLVELLPYAGTRSASASPACPASARAPSSTRSGPC